MSKEAVKEVEDKEAVKEVEELIADPMADSADPMAEIGDPMADDVPTEALNDVSPADPADSPSDPPDDLPDVDDALMEEMYNAYNYWHTHGYPEKASVLWECMEQKRRPPANLLPSSFTGIKPETAIDPSNIEVPPRYGPEASTEAWRAFAKKVLDMEPEIIDALPRADIIAILEEKKVIEKAKK